MTSTFYLLCIRVFGGNIVVRSSQEVGDLRVIEARCVSFIARLQRKLHEGSPYFVRERLALVLQWERQLTDTRAQLVAAGLSVVGSK